MKTVLCAVLIGFASASALAGDVCVPTWQAFGGTGMNNIVRTMAEYDDGSGSGPALFVGGQFTTSDGVATNGIAKWTGAGWQAIGTGVGGSSFLLGVHALAVWDDGLGGGPKLYAGGQFTSMNGVAADGMAVWDGRTWSAVGNGTMGPATSIVRALVVHDDGTGNGPALYATGSFTSIGGVAALRTAKWNGTAWSNVGGGLGSSGYALASKSSGQPGAARLYVGGIFVLAEGSPAIEVAQWNGTNWGPVGAGLGGVGVYSLAMHDDGSGGGPALYAGGEFTASGSQTVARIAKWNGSAWTNVSANGIGANSGVYALTTFDDQSGSGPALYAGGQFSTIGGTNAASIARWDGTAWSALDEGTAAVVFCLRSKSGSQSQPAALHVGGSFLVAGGETANCIAKWEGCTEPACADADLNCDGAVDGADLGILLGQWNGRGTADLNNDGVVDGGDLGILLGAWS